MVNEIMDEQADMACEDGATARNGYRERGPAIPVGDIVPRIPKLRAGTFFPEGLMIVETAMELANSGRRAA